MLKWNETYILKKSNKMPFFLFQKEEVVSANHIKQCQIENKVISLNVLSFKIKFFALFHSFDDNQRKT
jgi:hypothetical protein